MIIRVLIATNPDTAAGAANWFTTVDVPVLLSGADDIDAVIARVVAALGGFYGHVVGV